MIAISWACVTHTSVFGGLSVVDVGGDVDGVVGGVVVVDVGGVVVGADVATSCSSPLHHLYAGAYKAQVAKSHT